MRTKRPQRRDVERDISTELGPEDPDPGLPVEMEADGDDAFDPDLAEEVKPDATPAVQAPPARGPGSGRRGRQMITDETGVSKRTLQNRKAQREFRQRRANHMKELEDKLKEMEGSAPPVSSEMHQLIVRLKEENTALRNELQRVSPSSLFNFGSPIQVPSFTAAPPSMGQTILSPPSMPTQVPSMSPPPLIPNVPITPMVSALLPSSRNPAHIPVSSAYGINRFDSLVSAATGSSIQAVVPQK